MNRTVIEFNKNEISEILNRIGNNDTIHPLLRSKLEIALQSEQIQSQEIRSDLPKAKVLGSSQTQKPLSEQTIGLEINEEDLEQILDEFILPTPEDTDSTISIRKKIQQRLLDFRSQPK